jgi:fumarylacetoacetase
MFFIKNPNKRVGVAIGDYVLDLSAISGLFKGPNLSQKASALFNSSTLNAFMASGRPCWRETRARLQELLDKDTPTLRDDKKLLERALLPLDSVQLHLPADIGDYTDFYASKEHATNVGTMFRGKENALMPNWYK